MPTLYITKPGAVVRKRDERLCITHERETLLDVPLIRVDDVVAFGRVTMTTAAVQTMLERGISMAFLSEYGRYLGRLEPALSKNVFLRRAQYEASFDQEMTLEAAKSFVAGKLANMRTVLVRHARSSPSDGLAYAIRQIKKAEKSVTSVLELGSLLGVEGAASAAYFQVFGERIQERTGFSFAKRTKRPPKDPLNAMLSFGYALLANDFTGLLHGIGFDPYVGYLHQFAYGRASLALDLMEEFRAIIVDSVVLSCINKGMMCEDDFEVYPGDIVYLGESGRRTFLKQYEARKRLEVTHPVFGYKASYLRCMELQARLFGKWLQGEVESYQSFRVK